MKLNLLPSILLTLSFFSVAGYDIAEGSETDNCFALYENSNEAINCVFDQWQKSNNKLKEIIEETASHIKKNQNYIDPFNEISELTQGDVYQKRFLESQKTWEKYKQQYCLSIMTPVATDGFDYQRSLEQCEINMNKRRMQEIALMSESTSN